MPLKGRIDFRSDTITEPTDEMRESMKHAEVGDDVWGTDLTVKALEAHGAAVFEKEACLFFPSGTMANIAALCSLTTGRGEEILTGDKSHISLYEQGNSASIGGLHSRTVRNLPDGKLDLTELERLVRKHDDPHYPRTAVVCVENTHNMCTGSPVPSDHMAAIRLMLDRYEAVWGRISIHVDGARIFNAATALQTTVAELTRHADTVSVCLSKGLGAPMGALLLGTKEVIARAYRMRKALGGGLRQVGVVAAPAMIALQKMSLRLREDHETAHMLAEGLQRLPCVQLSMPPMTNIVKFTLADPLLSRISMSEFVARLKDANVDVITVDDGTSIRAVTHHHITKEDILTAIEAIASLIARTLGDKL